MIRFDYTNWNGGEHHDRQRALHAYEGIEALENWSRRLGLPTRLNELGIDDSKFEFMAKRACGYKSDGKLGHVELLDWQDVVEIYKLAL